MESYILESMANIKEKSTTKEPFSTTKKRLKSVSSALRIPFNISTNCQMKLLTQYQECRKCGSKFCLLESENAVASGREKSIFEQQ